jgi:hypothetical protein
MIMEEPYKSSSKYHLKGRILSQECFVYSTVTRQISEATVAPSLSTAITVTVAVPAVTPVTSADVPL